MSAPGHAGDGDRAQAYLLITGAGDVSHHAPREALKNESYCVPCVHTSRQESAMVPCQALRLLIYVVLWNKRRTDSVRRKYWRHQCRRRRNRCLRSYACLPHACIRAHIRLIYVLIIQVDSLEFTLNVPTVCQSDRFTYD